jgi:DNA-binding transcriptional ArsR family regulator
MLEALLESAVKEKILLFLLANDGSYPSEIARNFSFNLNAVQFQLKKLEKAGVLTSQLRGKVRLYGLDPRYPFSGELQALLRKAFALLDSQEKEKFYVIRPQLRPTAAPDEKVISSLGAEKDKHSPQPNRPGSIEKAIKKRKRAKPIHYYPRKTEPLDFSLD